MNRNWGVSALASILGVVSGCTTVPDGDADNWAGGAAAAEMCKSMRAFVRAPLDTSGLRRAWFLPFGYYEDGSIDFYAPMASEPSDDASKAFYEHKVGQLTHYLRAPDFAAALASCLTRQDGYARICQSQTSETFRASFTETRSGRSIEILAAEKSTSLLVAEKGWNGNLEQSIVFKSSEETPNKSMQPTCEDARG